MLAAGLAGAAAAAPGAALCQTFGQILDSEIPLETIGELHGVRDRPRPELQPAPLRIDGMAISASLDTALGSTSNVLGAQSNARTDGFAEWAPQLIAALEAGPDRSAQLTLDYTGKRYFITPAKRQDGYRISADGHYGFGPGGMLFAEAFHQRIYEDQLAGSFPANGGGAVAIDQTQVTARLAETFNRVKLTGAVAIDRLAYHDTVTTTGALLPQSYRNDTVLRASSRLDYTLLADTALFAQASWRDTDYAANSVFANRSSREWRLIGGISADVSGLIRLSAGIGGYWRQYRTPAVTAGAGFVPNFGRIAGLAWDLRGAYYLSTLTTLSLQAKREYVGANLTPSPGYEATSTRFQLDHEFLRNLLVSVSLGAEGDRFRLVTRRDHLHDYALWADYWLSPHLLVKPRFEWLDRASSGAVAGPDIAEFRTQLALSVRN